MNENATNNDQNVKGITRMDLFNILNKLDARVTSLSRLIESRIEEQTASKNDYNIFIKCFKS